MKGTLLYYPANDYLVMVHQIPSYITKIFLWHCIKYKAPNFGTIKVNIIKNERGPSLFISKLLLKFQNILRNTTQVIIRNRVKILFSIISSPITLERQKWKSSKNIWNQIFLILIWCPSFSYLAWHHIMKLANQWQAFAIWWERSEMKRSIIIGILHRLQCKSVIWYLFNRSKIW